jgi:hypothetical protein
MVAPAVPLTGGKPKEATMKSQKAAAKPKKYTIGGSKSGLSVAQALVTHFPKDAEKIVKLMGDAATSNSMKRKLQRVAASLVSLRKEGGGQ